jgi:AraC family transcriptional regulator, regulatory protein of adaptative response / DNA-3-methyladenine glycosylase II
VVPAFVRESDAGRAPPGAVAVRLPFRAPLYAPGLLAWLGARAVPGVEELEGEAYRRSLRLPGGPGVVELRFAADHVRCVAWLDDERDLLAAVERCRALLDLDADAVAIDAALTADPLLAPLVAAAPGRRAPGHVDGPELAVRAVLGQQVSVAGAATVAGRLVAAAGEPLSVPVGAVTHLFPVPAALATLPLPMPAARERALRALAAALQTGAVDLRPGADPAAARRALLALPGVGPWTAEIVALRALCDRDAFPVGDLALRRALASLGPAADPERWRPWRAYAAQHLWALAARAGGAPDA